MAFLIAFLLFLFPINAKADWYILLPKKLPPRRPVPKNVPVPKPKPKKVKPKPYTVELKKILSPDFSIPLNTKKISREELLGKNVVIVFINELFSPFTESLASALEKNKSKDTVFILVSTSDADFGSVELFKKLLGIKKVIVTADSYLLFQFRLKLNKLSVPAAVVVDKYGFIRYFSPNLGKKQVKELVLELNNILNSLNKKG